MILFFMNSSIHLDPATLINKYYLLILDLHAISVIAISNAIQNGSI